MRPILLGIAAAFFFAFTFVLNASMELGGGSWIWSASLRYFFMVPFLWIFVWRRGKVRKLFQEMSKRPKEWFVWSFVGFGLFYAPICFAAAYAPGWLIASTWQITIISGALLSPLFYEIIQTKNGPVHMRGQIPWRSLTMSLFILLGVMLIQVDHAQNVSIEHVLLGIIPVLIASFAYPLGNRKMMEVVDGRLHAYERVLGMTLASMPLWLILAIYGVQTVGLPSAGQTLQTFLVAISSGIIATVLFFMATDLVRGNMQKLAAVEATQSLEVLFTLAGEVLLLSILLPSTLALVGITIVIIGNVLHSIFTGKLQQRTIDKSTPRSST